MIFSQKLVDRYDELKQRVPDCILLMQVGAFMQVMNEDARAVSQVTGLKLRMAGSTPAPRSWGAGGARSEGKSGRILRRPVEQLLVEYVQRERHVQRLEREPEQRQCERER